MQSVNMQNELKMFHPNKSIENVVQINNEFNFKFMVLKKKVEKLAMKILIINRLTGYRLSLVRCDTNDYF